jgi:hypothetical protein
MYFSINYNNNNIYLYKSQLNTSICKANFSYSLNSDSYNKLIFLTTNNNNTDIIKLYQNDQVPLSFNTNWALDKSYLIDDSYYKNILIPPSRYIEQQTENPDINSINSLCQDNTNINKLPNILCYIKDKKFIFSKWIGFSQVWCANYNQDEYMAYAYLYFFKDHTIFMASMKEKNQQKYNDIFDTDIMSIVEHKELIHDEFNRINCSEHMPIYKQLEILQNPINDDLTIKDIKILTEYNE